MTGGGVYRFWGMLLTSLVAAQCNIHTGPDLPGQVRIRSRLPHIKVGYKDGDFLVDLASIAISDSIESSKSLRQEFWRLFVIAASGGTKSGT